MQFIKGSAFDLLLNPAENFGQDSRITRLLDPTGANYYYNALEAEKARTFSAQEAEKNRKWQEEMSNTSFQRGVEDMKKAGLNPYLAYQQGGATTPSGATATTSVASSSAQDTFIKDIINSAFKLALGIVSPSKKYVTIYN